jgi:hypothetical protein
MMKIFLFVTNKKFLWKSGGKFTLTQMGVKKIWFNFDGFFIENLLYGFFGVSIDGIEFPGLNWGPRFLVHFLIKI